MGDVSTTHSLMIGPAMLPNGDNVVFRDSSFFKNNGPEAELPSPAMVRAQFEQSDLYRVGQWGKKPWAVPFWSLKLVVKFGASISIAEGQCMWAIGVRLGHQVPVPEIYGWCKDGEEEFVYMQFIEGRTLEDAWDSLSKHDQAEIHGQLGRVVHSLRSLAQPLGDAFLGDINRQPLRDWIFETCERPTGPFPSVKAFNDYFMELQWQGPERPPRPHAKRPLLSDNFPVVFTHADLTPSNILITSPGSERCRIVAIIDWHQSGWYPAYWEAGKSISNTDPNSQWGQGLPAAFTPHGEVLPSFSWMMSTGVAI